MPGRGVEVERSKRAIAVGVLLLAAPACDGIIGLSNPSVRTAGADDGGPDGATEAVIPPFSSGTRLRAMVVEAAGGATAWNGWYDTQLGAACAFTLARDGKQRCLPNENISSYFAGPDCSTPIWVAPPDDCAGPSPKYVQVQAYVPPLCSQGYAGSFSAVFPLDQASPPQPTSFSYGSLGAPPADCYPTTQSPGQALGLGPEFVPSSFVAATTTTLVPYGDGTLAARLLVADDGATQVLAIVNASTQQDCLLLGTSSYGSRCLPSSIGGAVQAYADPGCSVPANSVDLGTSLGPQGCGQLPTPESHGHLDLFSVRGCLGDRGLRRRDLERQYLRGNAGELYGSRRRRRALRDGRRNRARCLSRRSNRPGRVRPAAIPGVRG